MYRICHLCSLFKYLLGNHFWPYAFTFGNGHTAINITVQVQLIPYNPDVLDESVLWTESKDLGDGYRTVRMVNNIRLNVDAFNGDKNHGGVREGTTVVLWEWKKGDNQRWKIIPYCKSLNLFSSCVDYICRSGSLSFVFCYFDLFLDVLFAGCCGVPGMEAQLRSIWKTS